MRSAVTDIDIADATCQRRRANPVVRVGEPNAAIQAMIDAAPSQGDTAKPDSGLEASDWLPSGRGYYSYTGSLTTPPYTEGVRWQVMSEVLEVSEEQVAQLAADRRCN